MNRMVVAVLSIIGLFISIYTLLYKLGLLGELVCGTGGCETVQNSPWSYFLGVPVAGWGIAGYFSILTISMLGTLPRFLHSTWVSLLMLLLSTGAFSFSIYLSYLEEFVIGAWCQWCIASSVVATLLFLFTLPELKDLRRTR